VNPADPRRHHSPEKSLPGRYGCAGLVDMTTIEEALAAKGWVVERRMWVARRMQG
jgi:hypothetical protein